MNENKEIRDIIKFDEIMNGCRTAAISGHIRPDGDSVGSCLGLAHFLRTHYPDVQTDVYLDYIQEEFRFLVGSDLVKSESKGQQYDVFFCLDCSSESRLGEHGHLMKTSKKTVCIDHHLTASKEAMICYIDPHASSASELTARAVGIENIDKESAEAFYLGIVHDTGVFQYSCTSSMTMQIGGALMDKGIDYSRICADTFPARTPLQAQLLGKALAESELHLDGRVISSFVTNETLQMSGALDSDLSGIVAQLRHTRGTDAAVFLYEREPGQFRVSLRSNENIDVSRIASCFGGGGHARASGCTISGKPAEIIDKVLYHMKKQLSQGDGGTE